MTTIRLISLLSIAIFAFISGCGTDDSVNPDSGNNVSLSQLPADTGGEHIAQVLGTTSADYGYYVYLPGGYEEVSSNYPLLVFLHGLGERGDGSSNMDVLNRVLKNGPPKMIQNGSWSPKYPMIVVSPQYHGSGGDVNNWGAGDPQNLKGFIEFMIKKYRVNTHRIYLTGLSHGGNGVYDYLTRLSDSVSHIAAAVPVAAYGKSSGFNYSSNTPIWVFVGDNDVTNMKTSKNFVTGYNSQSPSPKHKAKITIFNGAGHDVWTRTYNGDGIGKADPSYDAFNQSVYDWMFKFTRD